MGIRAISFILIISISYLGTGIADDDGSKKIQARLYTIIHNLALPNFEEGGDITERFILLMPGQVLDYYDYCPIEKLSALEKKALDPSRLPPDENRFKLGDTVPTLESLAGGTTGKHLSVIYDNILYLMNTTSSSSDVFNQPDYLSAMHYLQMERLDPENASGGYVPLYELYYRYKTQYYDTKMQVNRWLAGNRSKIDDFSKYETWYHENYQSLTQLVSAAYTQWLVLGEKGPVEDKLAAIDVKSMREEIEAARNILQNTEEPSLDGGTKYYPTHFVPSNWYEYLLASDNQLTSDQIMSKISDLQMRVVQLTSMMKSNIPSENEANNTIANMKNTVTATEKNIQEASVDYSCFRYLCQQKRAKAKRKVFRQEIEFLFNEVQSEDASTSCSGFKYKTKDPCNELNEAQTKLDVAREEAVQAATKENSARNQLHAYSSSDSSITGILDSLKTQIDQLQEELKTAPKPVPQAAASLNGTGQLTQKEIEENWMYFSFDSDSSAKSVSTSSTTYKAALSFSVGGALWSVSGGASFSRATQDFSDKMSRSDVSITGKFLRVTINRNWFQPSIFSLGDIHMENGVHPVSPGAMSNEIRYVTLAKDCLLPEYTTAFLLAKDLSLKFRGADSNTTSHAVQMSASAHLKGSYGPFSASASFSYGHQSSNLKVSSLSDGLQIDIPGAQIIGYYTSVLPKFPNEP